MDMTSNYSKKTLTKPTSDVPFVSITRVGGILPAQVSFNGEPSYKLSKWLKEEPKPPKSSRTMPNPLSFEIDGEKYIWITNFVGQEALFISYDLNTPIAWYVEGRRRVVDGERLLYAPYLALRSDAETIQDVIVASLLEVEIIARGVRNKVNISENPQHNAYGAWNMPYN